MFTSILVGVDRSQHARVALGQAVDIARTQKASLTVLVAYRTTMPWGLWRHSPKAPSTNTSPASAASADAIADEARSAIPAEVSAEVLVVDAMPAQALLDRAAAGNHDLIVVGSRGRGDAGSFLLGSVSHAVLRGSRVPVLIVHVPSVEACSEQPIARRRFLETTVETPAKCSCPTLVAVSTDGSPRAKHQEARINGRPFHQKSGRRAGKLGAGRSALR